MAWRATGPGLIEVNSAWRGAGVLRALLYNFDFDDMAKLDLKMEHARFLRARALPLLVGNRGMVLLLGQASQVGADEYNVRLSRRRVQRVADFLSRNGIAATQMRPNAVGERQSTSRLRDDQRDRSVEIAIAPRPPLDSKPPPVVPLPPRVTTRFRLRLVGDITVTGAPRLRPLRGSLGGGPAADAMLFEIQDVQHELSAFYGYGGLGIGAGINLAWLSATESGPWNDFTTSAPMNVGDFGGFTRFTTAGAGNYTLNWLHMMGTPEGVSPVYLMINTRTTYGAGATSTAGPLQLVAGPMPTSRR